MIIIIENGLGNLYSNSGWVLAFQWVLMPYLQSYKTSFRPGRIIKLISKWSESISLQNYESWPTNKVSNSIKYVVHSISFQTFVQAFKIVVDSWKFTMLLLYMLWDDWPIFRISRSNQQLQQQLEYTLLKPDCHSWWISKMQSECEEERYAIKFCFKLGKNAMQWKLNLLLWPRDQETEFPVEACWLSQTQEGQTELIYPQTFDDPFFWQHWHDPHALGSRWTVSQQGILCWGFKGVQDEIPSEEASTLQIKSVAFPPGQCTSLQLQPCHRLFDQDGHQHSSSSSL